MKTNEELDKYLCEKYPKLFRDRHGDMRTTCMVWGIECGAGWGNILEMLCSNIQWHIDESRKSRASALKFNRALAAGLPAMIKYYQGRAAQPAEWHIKYATRDIEEGTPHKVPEKIQQVIITQIKEKFGSLRFYYCGGDKEIDGMVRMAESLSGVTCDVCGSPGESNNEGWISVRCATHRTNIYVDESSVEP